MALAIKYFDSCNKVMSSETAGAELPACERVAECMSVNNEMKIREI